jgi:2-methylisocitrate lyase-like PEP mutase family enzyme
VSLHGIASSFPLPHKTSSLLPKPLPQLKPLLIPLQTGAGTTMSRLGLADMGVATLNDMHANASTIASLSPSTPLIADADTGYGGAIQVGRTVTSYIRAGVAGLHLEDQVVSKRCGHLGGKQLVATEEFVARIRAAVLARKRSGCDIVIIARTDAVQGQGYDEAVTRLRSAVEAGAEVAFLEGVTSRADAERFVKDLTPTPCLFNNVPGGASPDFSTKDAKEIGYRIAIYPTVALEEVYTSVRRGIRGVLDTGVVRGTQDDGSRVGIRELFDSCGLQEAMDFDREAGGGAWDGV